MSTKQLNLSEDSLEIIRKISGKDEPSQHELLEFFEILSPHFITEKYCEHHWGIYTDIYSKREYCVCEKCGTEDNKKEEASTPQKPQ